MPIVLYRVDERLIHGQVMVGWGGQLHVDRVIVVDDQLATSPWEQELYRLGLSMDVEANFHSLDEARHGLDAWRLDPRRTILLLRDVPSLCRLAEGGLLRGERVNLGGIHHAAGRRRVLPYLFLSADEERDLSRVAADGVKLSAQDLPSSRSVSLDQLLAET